MSDCSSHAFDIPGEPGYTAPECVVHPPKGPSLAKLSRLYGEPPWAIVVPDMFERIVPQEATGLVETVIWRGRPFKVDNPDEQWELEDGRIVAIQLGETRYEKVRECHAVRVGLTEARGFNGSSESLECSGCGKPLFAAFRYCPSCGAKVVDR